MKNLLFLPFAFLIFFTSCQNKADEEEKKEIVYNIPTGFELEILFSPSENNRGSWVSLAEGDNGKFYVSDQYGDLYQFDIPAIGEVLDSTQVDSVDLEIGHAHGLLWAFNSLYVSVNDRWEDEEGEQLTENGSGIYRLWDENSDGELDQMEMLLKLEGAGEHGPHSLVLSPDGEDIYFIAGNHTMIPEALAENSRLPATWDEDNLFPQYLDAMGHANDIEAPGGWIARFNPEGTDWELVAAGFRNPFDMGFNKDGELFAFDADMEWDIGMPWYRPIRICHVTSGAEFGWRTGSGKWPAYYPDNLPAAVGLGQGSPTAVVMSHDLKLPSEHQNGMVVFDWSFGTAYFVDLEADGSSYTGTREEFFSGTPLPLTDAVAGSDGALYFASGGRRLDSHFYRLRYTGEEQPAAKLTSADNAVELRTLRKELESFHNQEAPRSISLMWKNLNHTDRFIKYAARIALEHQPSKGWENRILRERDPDRILQAAVALARVETSIPASRIFQKLSGLKWADLSRSQQLDLLRAIGLVGLRMEMPDDEQKSNFHTALGPQFPSEDYALDRELGQLLIFLGDQTATEKCLQLLAKHTREKTITHPSLLSKEVSDRSEQYGPTIMEVLENMPPTEALYYGTILSHAQTGWTDAGREQYFNWFFDGLNAAGGRSFKPFLENIRRKAMTHVPKDQQDHYEQLSGIYQPGADFANLPQPKGPGMEYNNSDIHRILRKGLEDYESKIEVGKQIYEAALCGTCHRMRGKGGSVGPDLTELPTRFKRGEIVTSIFSPSLEISDQYTFTLFTLQDGKKIAGKVLSEKDDKIVIAPNPYSIAATMELAKSEVVNREPSPVSPMPPNLLNRLNEEEITDLFAYILSGGDKRHYFYGGKKGLKDKKK